MKTKQELERNALNHLALNDPMVGDYWTERVFHPYFLVVQVNGDKITVLDGRDRIQEPDGWMFDFNKAIIVNKAWMEKYVKYGSIPGFIAYVTRNENILKVANKWNELHDKGEIKDPTIAIQDWQINAIKKNLNGKIDKFIEEMKMMRINDSSININRVDVDKRTGKVTMSITATGSVIGELNKLVEENESV